MPHDTFKKQLSKLEQKYVQLVFRLTLFEQPDNTLAEIKDEVNRDSQDNLLLRNTIEVFNSLILLPGNKLPKLTAEMLYEINKMVSNDLISQSLQGYALDKVKIPGNETPNYLDTSNHLNQAIRAIKASRTLTTDEKALTLFNYIAAAHYFNNYNEITAAYAANLLLFEAEDTNAVFITPPSKYLVKYRQLLKAYADTELLLNPKTSQELSDANKFLLENRPWA